MRHLRGDVRRWLPVFALLAAVVAIAACGKKGDPIPPEKPKSQGVVVFRVSVPF